MNIIRINTFWANNGKSNELFDFLQSLVPYIKSSRGCLDCQVLRSIDDETQFAVIEKWDSIESHQNSVQNFPKEKMQSVMSLFGKPPEGMYYQV